jgi:hypothetical protein
LLAGMEGLPGYGAAIAGAPAMLRAATHAASTGRDAVTLLDDLPAAATLPELLAAAGPRLPELAPALDALQAELADLPAGANMPPALAATTAAAPGAARLAALSARLGPQLAWLLGMDSPRSYLILVQNNHELRATGGFISGFGRVVVDKGAVTDLDVVDSYAIFRESSEYPPAPAPMQEYMGIQLLVARDANWSPHLPEAADVAARLYTQDTGLPVDGVITVDLNAIRHLVGALDSLRLPGLDAPLTAANVEAQLVQLWETPLEGDAEPVGSDAWRPLRKDFMPQIAAAVLGRLQAGEYNPLALLGAVAAALEERALQVWVRNPATADALAAVHWDGALQPEPGADFLAVVDTNVGYNKVDAAMQRELAYRVQWPEGDGAPALAMATITYTHPVEADDPDCTPTSRYGDSYADLVARCYFDYLRLYVPAGSELVDVQGIAPETVTSAPGVQGTTQFAGYLTLRPGAQQRVTFTYRLPPTLQPAEYRLILQRQAGTPPLPLTLAVAGGTPFTTTVTAGRFVWPVE